VLQVRLEPEKISQEIIIIKGWVHTIPILSAYFLLMGLVLLLTRVPSGNSMSVRGLSLCSAHLPNDANRDARYK
jgi:hypothetical protein